MDQQPRPTTPRGVAYLAFTEMWERFSFYGMQAILLLYMVDQALTPGHIENLLGMGGFRQGLEAVFGPMTNQALAYQIFGLYGGLVYLTPIIGGWLGDNVIGQTRAVVLGGVLMMAGHLLMALESALLPALLLLILGSGALKGNISAQVGGLYAPGDPGRTRAFSLYNVAINVGAFVAPLACGGIGEVYGWSLGFGLAAGGMLIGLIVYLSGLRHLPPDTHRRDLDKPRAAITADDVPVLWGLGGVLLAGIFFSTVYSQEFAVFNVWVREAVQRQAFGVEVPVTWFTALDGFFCIALTPIVLRLWRHQAECSREPTDLGKIGWGSLLGAAGCLCLTAASALAADGTPASMVWPIACYALMAVGFLYYWPTTLALISNASPRSLTGTMMGFAFMTQFVSGVASGWLGRFYEPLGGVKFWLLHAAISAAGGLLVLALIGPVNRRLHPET